MIFRNTDVGLKNKLQKDLTTEAENEIKIRLFSSANLVEAEAKQSIQRGVKSGKNLQKKISCSSSISTR